MSSTGSPSKTPKQVFFWTFIGALILLLIAAAAGTLITAFVLIALLLFVVGLVALVRGHFPRFGVPNRRAASGVLLLGVYFLVLGGVTATNSEDTAPVAIAAGDSCEVTGTINEDREKTFYCVPSESGDHVWGTAADFTVYQEAERQKIEDEAKQQAQATVEERDEELAAAEKRAEEAETELQEHKDEVKAAEEAREAEEAEEEAAAAEVAEERQRQEEAAQNTPAPAAPPEEPQNNTNSDSNVYYENCTAAREAGAAPVHRGEPGYGTHLDRDGDGIGCE